MINKKVVFLTGTRADYGKLKPLMGAVEASPLLDCFIYVTGMHLLEKFGSTYKEVVKAQYQNVYVEKNFVYGSSMSINLGRGIIQFSSYIEKIKPEIIIVHGDRIDALAGAITGALNNILVAHIEGGEVSGTIDESIRHAISKFAHIHFTCNGEATKRLIQLGEQEDNIFEIGSPDIDIMLSDKLPSLEIVKKYYDINFDSYAILMYHPVTTENDLLKGKLRNLIDALKESDKNYIVIYPNNDLGSDTILEEYSLLQNNDHIRMFPSLRFESFLVLLKNAEFIIGNSSAGVREAGIYGIPAIDLGNRQTGRYIISEAQNIQHVEEETELILKCINSISNFRHESMHFGKGNSQELFLKCLQSEEFWRTNIQKRFIDLGETI